MNKKSKLGYSKKSPYKNEPFIDIDSNSITMEYTEFPVLAIPDNDKPILMMPGKNYKFPNSKKVREVKLQHGGNFGLAGENTMPMSPFINLKPFINKYKLKHGGVIDYMATLPLEQQVQFAEEFDSFDPETQKEVEEYLKGGYYQSGGNVSQSDYLTKGNPSKTTSPKGLEESERSILSKGSKGEEVVTLQTFLYNKGFYKGSIDGLYGNKTKEAVKDYQKWFNKNAKYDVLYVQNDKPTVVGKSQKIKEDGIVGDETRSALMYREETKPKEKKRGKEVPRIVIADQPFIEPMVETYDVAQNQFDFVAPFLMASMLTPAGATAVETGAVSNLMKYGLKEVAKNPQRIIPKGITSPGNPGTRFFSPKTPSAYGTRIGYKSGGIYDYQMGGQPNAELEDQETLVTPDGELSKITGKTHDQGGVEVTIPDGTRIYSEHLKVPKDIVKQVLGKESKKKLSYADISKKFPTKPYIDILENPNSDQYQINTAEIKLTSNLGKLDTLFFAQEKEKQGKEKENKYKCGGMKKYQEAGSFGGSGAGVDFDWVTGQLLPPGQSILQYQATEENIPGMLPSIPKGGEQSKAKQIAAGFQRPQDWTTQFPKIHSEPAATVSTGVVLNLRNDVPISPKEDQTVQPSPMAPKVGSKQPKQSTKRRGVSTTPAPVVIEDSELQVPLPLDRLPQRVYSNLSSTSRDLPVPSTEQVADAILTQDNKDFQGRKKRDFKFGISPELAGTVADIGLALSDKLRVSEPTYYDRRKYPLFTRFVDFDDKEVQRMYDKNIQQIQNSNVPENVKQAKISELMGQYQDYQAKVDYGNLQRYEGKRERDTEKLQQYLDTNVDQRVADIESYRQRKARVDELRDAFYAQRKSRVVNSLKAYAEYADQISKANEFTPNYRINPITSRIDYRPQQQTNLRENILQQYQKKNQSRIDLGSGATAQIFGNVLIITDKDGKVSTQKLDQSE